MMNLNSPFFRLITNIGNLILVSILWIIGCIPIVTIGASTAALYYTCVKVIRHGRGYLFSSFLQAYRSNLKQGIVVTLLGILISFVLYMDFRYITALDAAPQYLVAIYQICMTFFASLLIYLVATMSRFSVSFFSIIKIICFYDDSPFLLYDCHACASDHSYYSYDGSSFFRILSSGNLYSFNFANYGKGTSKIYASRQ